jgi:hypothetical protein
MSLDDLTQILLAPIIFGKTPRGVGAAMNMVQSWAHQNQAAIMEGHVFSRGASAGRN